MEKKTNYARRYKEDFNWRRRIAQYWALYCVTYPFMKLFYNIKFEGMENVPKGGRYILAANHISYFDAFVVSIAVNKPLSFMAKKELFEKPVSRFFLNLFAAFAVNREKLEVSTMKTVRDLFKTNWSLGIFPQGGIRPVGKIENITRGFAFIAKQAKADIIPVSVTGCDKVNWVPFKAHAVVKVGKPISYELEADEIKDAWGEAIAEMTGFEYVRTTEEEAAKAQ